MSQNLVSILGVLTAVVTLPVGVLTALFLGFLPAAVVFVIGWFLLTPLLIIGGEELVPLLRERQTATATATEVPEEDPLEELKHRYARGEIDDLEFERRVERLVELDDVDASTVEAADLSGLDPVAEPDSEETLVTESE